MFCGTVDIFTELPKCYIFSYQWCMLLHWVGIKAPKEMQCCDVLQIDLQLYLNQSRNTMFAFTAKYNTLRCMCVNGAQTLWVIPQRSIAGIHLDVCASVGTLCPRACKFSKSRHTVACVLYFQHATCVWCSCLGWQHLNCQQPACGKRKETVESDGRS